jgi:YidC/Oxa1 family membrane protein insertase
VPAPAQPGSPVENPVSAPDKEKSSAAAAAVQANNESDIVVENELYRITFTNRGGEVKSWLLKKYKDDTQKNPLDLVNQAAAAKFGLPLSFFTYDAGLKNRLNSALYVPSETGTISVAGAGSTPAT